MERVKQKLVCLMPTLSNEILNYKPESLGLFFWQFLERELTKTMGFAALEVFMMKNGRNLIN